MSQRHDEAFEQIRLEHNDVIAALTKASLVRKRGAPGTPGYDPKRLEAAIATAGDAYALLLIATAEAFLREYLDGIAVAIGPEPKLSMLIDKSAKELNIRLGRVGVRPKDKQPMHMLRVARNEYAHGHGRSVFPSVPRVQGSLSKFFSHYP